MNKSNFTPFPKLNTSNFILRQLKDEDDNGIFVTRTDERILKYIDIPKAEKIEDARKFIDKINNGIQNNEWIYWALSYKNHEKLIGTICLWNIDELKSKADIGFVLLPEFQGKNIMQEVIPVVLNYGFHNMNLSKIEGEVDPRNIKSIKIMEKFGFKYEYKLENTEIYSLESQTFKEKSN